MRHRGHITVAHVSRIPLQSVVASEALLVLQLDRVDTRAQPPEVLGPTACNCIHNYHSVVGILP